ncbi:hypothetical protein GA0070214_102434 [Micromonospora chaiyaphumensis]|uniref:Uncharacterized protein n=1 Tax=Micromonospora chaiyaphumensis TaxID=307119 RepID=A0A1C4VJ80_9ACTN|nr:hypothetical protein GA0070214_102434 [Micromonospora chaiyaphumensis]
MTRCPGRLARWALRGVLLCGGLVGAWALSDAVAPDAARAAEPARPGVLADLLDGARTIVGESVPPPLHLPAPSPARSGGADIEGGTAAADRGRPARPRVPPVKQTTVTEAITPVTRSVVDLVSPVVETIAPVRLLEPVSGALRPVTEPIVELLRPALAPVLDLTEPIIGPPAAPSAPPAGPSGDEPITGAPAPAGETPTARTAAPSTRPAPPTLALPTKAPSPRPAAWSAGRDEVPSGPAGVRVPPPGEPAPGPHGMPATPAVPGTTAGSGAGAGGPGIPADGVPHRWEPELRVVGHDRGRCDELVSRSSRPEPGPA